MVTGTRERFALIPPELIKIAPAVCIGALGGLLFGFDTVVVAGSNYSLTRYYHLSPARLGFTVSLTLWGTVASCLLTGIFAKCFRCRDGLQAIAVLFLISSLGSMYATCWQMLAVSRFVAGLAVGATAVLIPVFLTNNSPPAWRGRIVNCFQLSIGIGVLLAYSISMILCMVLTDFDMKWRYSFGMAAVPSVLLFVGSFFLDRSRVTTGPDLLSMGTAKLFTRSNLRPILLVGAVALFNQLTGVNAILYYLNNISMRGGFSLQGGDRAAVLVGALNLVFSVLSMAFIDSLGRRKLLLLGSVGAFVCLSGVAASISTHQHRFVLTTCIVLFNLVFSLTFGPTLWVYISEIFPQKVRLKGQSFGSGVHWITDALVSWIFPVVSQRSAAAPFVFFAAMMLLQFFCVWRFFPETRDSLEQECSIA